MEPDILTWPEAFLGAISTLALPIMVVGILWAFAWMEKNRKD